MNAPSGRFLRLGGHPAVDFLNTAYEPQGVAIEEIGDGAALLDWLVSTGLVDEGTARADQRRLEVAAEARRVREWTREWLGRWRRAPHGSFTKELETLNRLLARAPLVREVVRVGAAFQLVERVPREPAETLLVPIAEQIAALVTEEDPALLKSCAGEDCTVWFLDRTRAGRRRFCSASVCGNRAKVAAFRRRQRES
jgi:predicted RNA-binding Zn ribbon-like protein